MSTWTPAAGVRMHARLLRPGRRTRGPVVMLHGLGVSAASLGPLAERLAERSTTLVCDLPGFGRTAADGPWSTRRVAGAVEEVLERRGLGRVVVVGHSWGCHVAALLAARHPERVGALVLLSPSFDRAPGGAPGHVLRLIADAPMERPSLVLGGARDYLRAGPRRLIATLRDARRIHLDEVVAGIGAPILVVRGSRDPLATGEWVRRIAAAAPDGRVAVVPRAAHGLGHDAPGAVAGAVSTFLEGSGHRPRMSRSHAGAPADQ
ncbi:MAG: alpha/beta hydrolase [Thermoleophilia bacterium]|nr:alpha/beta hydrolase [Thermoleophilia bacterium]